MISIKKTILATIEDKVKKMRYLGQYDPKAFKKIMSLIVINFIYDWVYFNDKSSEHLQLLRDLQTGIIVNDCTFKLVNKAMFADGDIVESQQPYRNVNTPQSNDDWKRVWDAPVVTIVSSKILSTPTDWQVDPDYQPVIVVFVGNVGLHPDIDMSNKSVHEKMNIYLNRETNEMWYYDTNCEWKKVSSTGDNLSAEQVIALIKENRPGVTSELLEGKLVTRITDDKEDKSVINPISEEEINALL